MEKLQICPDCLIGRIEQRRRERRAKIIGLLFMVGVAVFIVITLSKTTNIQPNTVGPADAASDTPANTSAANPATAPDTRPAAEPAQSNSPSDTVASPTMPEMSGQVDSDAPPELSAEPGKATANNDSSNGGIGDAISATTIRALDSGQAERWKAAGKSGYVVVSAAQPFPDRICRNAYATIIKGQDQTQSPSRQWCQPGSGGSWAPTQ
jgi:hypothetical protein